MAERATTPILHADADAFFAAVEQRDDPRLRGRPVIVGGGVVMAASYEARAHGVRGAMSGGRARRLCPDAIVVRPRFEAYVAASRELFAVFEATSPVVEGLSLEEAFLDVRGLEQISGTPTQIAVALRAATWERVGLRVSVGVARTRALAKLASRAAKPDGLLVVEPPGEVAFLHPLRVEELWGVGPATAAKLHAHGLRTVGELAGRSLPALVALLGPAAGRRVHALVQRQEVRRVHVRRGRRTYGAQRAIGRGPHRPAELDATLVTLVDRLTRRMRASCRVGRTVTLRLRFGDCARASRSRRLARPTAASRTILALLRELLAAATATIERRGITLLGVTISGLANADPRQLRLPIDDDGERIDAAVDRVRDAFGDDALTRGVLLRPRGPQITATAGRDPPPRPGA